MNKKPTIDELVDKANELLKYRNILTMTTAKGLERAIRQNDAAMLKHWIRLASLPKYATRIAKAKADVIELAKIEQMLAEQAEAERLAAMERVELAEQCKDIRPKLREGARFLNVTKVTRFEEFMESFDPEAEMEVLKAWYKRAMDYLQGIEAKRRQVPMQTQKVA